MSLIAGYLSKKNKIETDFLKNRVNTYSMLNNYSEGYENIVIETKFGHIIQKYGKNYPLQNRPCKDEDDNLLLILGFLFKTDSISTNKKLLELCVQKSTKVIEDSEGEFVSIFVCGHSGEIHIINDRFASRPFYILHCIDGIYFSSNLHFLLYLKQDRNEVDILGWLQIFAYGHTIGSRTTFRDIKRIPPASHLTISPNNIEQKQYWHLEYAPEHDLNLVKYCEQVFDAFKAGAESRTRLVGKGIVPLSGGLDSRLVAGAIPNGADFETLTFVNSTETSKTPDVIAAAEVSRILGFEHHVERLDLGLVSKIADDVVKLTGGLTPLHHPAKVMGFVNLIKRQGNNFLLGGAPGNNLSGSLIPSLNYLDPGNIRECIDSYCHKKAIGGRKKESVLALIFGKHVLDEYLPLITNSILESFENIGGPTAAHRVSAWEMSYGFPAFGACSPIHNHPDLTEAFIHLDYTYCNLMLHLSGDLLYKSNFYAFMIYTCLSQLQHIVYANTGLPLSGKILHFDQASTQNSGFSSKAQQLILKTKKLGKRFFVRKTVTTSYPYHYSLLRRDENLFPELIEIIQSYPGLQTILDVKRCIRFLDNFTEGKLQSQSFSQDAELLGSLATICYSFKHFDSC